MGLTDSPGVYAPPFWFIELKGSSISRETNTLEASDTLATGLGSSRHAGSGAGVDTNRLGKFSSGGYKSTRLTSSSRL